MNLPNLSQIWQVMNWHKNQRDKKPGEGVGIFALLPKEISDCIPIDGKEKEDNSPHHITVLYIGTIGNFQTEKVIDVIKNVCSQIKPFKVKIGNKPRRFMNDKNQTVYHMPIFSKKLKRLNGSFKDELRRNLINIIDKYPEYKPHTTLEYVNEGEKSKYKDFELKEKKEFIVSEVWIFGLSEPILVPLGK